MKRVTKMWFEHWRCGPGFIARYSRRKGWMNATLLKEERACEPFCKGGQTACQYEVNGVGYTTWATCSDKDNFSYKRGREIALGRMIKLLYGKGGFSTESEVKEQLNKVMFQQGSSDDRYDWIEDNPTGYSHDFRRLSDFHGYDSTIPESDDDPKDEDDPADYSAEWDFDDGSMEDDNWADDPTS